MPSSASRRNKRRATVIEEPEYSDNEEAAAFAMTFSSQAPQATQEIASVRESDQRNLMSMSEEKREKAVLDTSRVVLVKALAGLPMERAKVLKDAGVSDARVSTAVWSQVDERLRNCFGFELTQMPDWMKKRKSVPKSMKDRYYVYNTLHDADGDHSKLLHAAHDPMPKGFLMIVLALCYCKGEPRSDGSRWISDRDLYALLHRLDDALPAEPPAVGSKRGQSASIMVTQTKRQNAPNPDALLHSLVQKDYLLRERGEQNDDECMLYSIGPRSAIEVGNEQVLTFCAEILDEEVTEVMMTELRATEKEEAAA